MSENGWEIENLCVGKPAKLPDGKRSAIAKAPVEGPVHVSHLGLQGDTQVDKRHHGGPEMAVHIYPLDHHAFWRHRLDGHSVLDEPGAFGGNVAIAGIDETQVRIGERFRFGSAVLEIGQPRMPCATIERRFEHSGMIADVLESGRCGWYCRVVDEGMVCAGDRMVPIGGTGTPYTVRDTFMVLSQPRSPADPALLLQLAACEALDQLWRDRATAKAARMTP